LKTEENILIAEDDPNDAFLLQRTIQKLGIRNPVQIVHDGAEAIDYLEGNGKYADRVVYPFPCVLMTDLKMPRINGFEVLEWMKNHSACSIIPTIVWSSSNRVPDVIRAYELGVSCYLKKPNDTTAWAAMIELLFKFWNICEKPPSKFAKCS
jgi:CheY-like chemotaxis protein